VVRPLDARLVARSNRLLSVYSAPSSALARLIFEFPRNRRSYEEARQPDVRAGQPFAEGRGSRRAQDESADWRIWDRRDPGGHTGAFGDAGSKS